MKKATGLLIILLVCMGMSANVTWAAFTHTLENTGCGGGPYPDNALFQIVGDELRTNAVIQQEDYPAGCIICIRTNDGAGGTYDEEFVITINNIPPSVTSIVRANGNPTNAATVDFTVTFRESVTGVDTGDFSLTTGGGIAGASVNSVAGSGTTYTVTVDTGTGNGTIRLDLTDNDSISDGTDPLGPGDGSYTTGENYTLDKDGPGITSFTRLTPASSPTNADTLILRATFDEDVQNVDAVDFTVSGTTATITNVNPQSALVYDITVSGGDLAGLNGPVQLNLAGGQNITDLVGNSLPAGEPATDESYTVDNDAPGTTSFTLNTPATSPTNSDTLVFRATFDEDVQNVTTGDFTVTGSTATVTGVVANSALEYDLTVSGGDLAGLNGTVSLDLAGGQDITDLAGNGLPTAEPGTDQSYTVDNTAPGLNSFARQTPATNPTNADTLVFRATFDGDVQNVDATDFTVTGTTASITNVAVITANSVYDLTVSGGDLAGYSGSVGLNVAGTHNITDPAGNALAVAEPATDETYTMDNNAPTLSSLTLQTPGSSPTNGDVLVFRATFDQDVQNVDAADFSVTGTTATITGVAVITANTVFDLTVSGGDLAGLNGVVGINLSGTQDITDPVGNALPAGEPATDETYTVDNDAPGITSFALDTPATSPTNADTLVFRATFDEDVQNVDGADFDVTGTTATITNVNTVNASTYDLTVSGGDLAGLDADVGIDLAGGQDITDLAGNTLPAGEPGTDETYTVDNTAPTVTINQAAGQTDPGTSSPINFTVTFSETVTGFDIPADVTLSGTAGPTTAVITGTGPYNVAVSGMSSVGTVIAAINTSVAQDAAGNNNAASTSTDNQVTYSPPPPSVVSIDRADTNPTNAASVDYTVTFDQAVSGIDTGDFSLATSGTTGNIASVSAASGTTVTVTVNTIAGDGTLGLNLIDNDSVVNVLSNPLGGTGVNNGNFTGQLYTVDRVAPTVTSVSATTAEGTYYIGDTINITVQFDESVTVIGGPPTLTLETGVSDAVVDYSSGSPSTTLTFTYTALETHTSADLDYLNTTALATGGGTIRDTRGNDAVLTLAAPGAANSLGANKALAINGTPRLVINEIDYNQGAPDTAEFIEIKNVSGAVVNLNGYSLLLVDSAVGPGVYQTINLANVDLAAGDYYVICDTSGSTVGNCDQSAALGDDFIQDGAPDAIKLVKGIAALDTVSYDGDTPGFTELVGAPADNDLSDTYGLSRFVDGSDTNDNSADFTLRCTTPGGTNSAVAPPAVCNNQPTFTGTPAITGTPVPVKTLSLINTGTNDLDGNTVTLTYQWRADGADIGGAIGATLLLNVGQVGKTITCAITADDGQGQGNSTLTVVTAGVVVQPDSDGDGVPDGSDLCPGGNDAIDIDHDGIPDDCDSSLPPITHTVSASHGEHGMISPSGPQTVIEGATIQFTVIPEAGYVVTTVGGTCSGTLTEGIFITARILTDCTVAATFETAPDGDSDGIADSADACPDDPDNDTDGDGTCGDLDTFPDDPALFEPGIDQVDFRRVDGRDAPDNLVDGNPKLDVEYRFTVIINDLEAGSAWLVIDGYPQRMDCGPEPVDFSGPVECTFDLILGPAGSHNYHVEARSGDDYDPTTPPLARTNEMPGPVIELLHGANMVGLAKALLAGIGLEDLLGSSQVYGWFSQGLSGVGNSGAFVPYDNNSFHAPGQGYFMERQDLATLPDLSAYPDYTAPEFIIDLTPGWNLITNPYGGQVPLSQVMVQVGDENPVPWLDACSANLLVNGIYWYQGDDWGSVYGSESCGGDPDAMLVPWRGYWVYVVRDNGDYHLIIPRPE
ncbi:MAG: lamin tail domain-containing protein [Proteobacteria bacterium]|nr:lamin tail domain-containing protein [Pseudomonadota bacterium]MBU1687524.1 lamin tail domain-containing protein [Pseudomonadota bacterium]